MKIVENVIIGIVQGRLSPPINGMIQAFPAATWKEEFKIASEIGFQAIEFIFDGPQNPLLDPESRKQIREIVEESGVSICSVSSDYSMHYPLFGSTREETLKLTTQLIQICKSLEIPRVGISFEDNSSIFNEEHREEAISSVTECIRVAEDSGIVLTMETSLYDFNLKEFFNRVSSPNLKVNFDLGNSCALGEDSPNVIRSIGDLIGGIHIKDRNRFFGSTVPLGEGGVDFRACFEAIKSINYTGPFVVQGARGDDDIKTAQRYLEFVRNHID